MVFEVKVNTERELQEMAKLGVLPSNWYYRCDGDNVRYVRIDVPKRGRQRFMLRNQRLLFGLGFKLKDN